MSGLLSATVFLFFFFDMTNSNIEVPEVGVQSLERGGEVALLCMTVCIGVGQHLHTLQSQPMMDEPQSFGLGMLTNNIIISLSLIYALPQGFGLGMLTDIIISLSLIYALAVRIAGAPQMISQPVSIMW